ncbi:MULTISPECIES: hypothetical protein [Nostoc]|uniref:Uncharacterized protein n=2 Tax=Nostoc TaxID=1177 RepID=A0ABR8IAH1_9NOSO|nr:MULTISPECIES: hypothetical protein [Nostoc]MBD2562128.1 hypothetical protein [Nostoc linckia FACHB-391]MBD2647530.1 hypothetical protein [Nostoc foliaceum FACHB-393]
MRRLFQKMYMAAIANFVSGVGAGVAGDLGLVRISHKFEMQRGRGAEGKEQGTLNSPLLPCSLAPLPTSTELLNLNQ